MTLEAPVRRSGHLDSNIRLRYWQNDFFLSDQIRVSPTFTLTLGVRYELNTVPTEVDPLIESTFDSEEVRLFAEIERATAVSIGQPAVSGLEQFLDGRTKIFVRHRFVYSLIWDLPFFQENKVLGGWQVSSIGTFQTGQPYSVLFCCDLNLDGNLTDRVDPGATNPSTAGRNGFRAPGIQTVDLALNKFFRFRERHKLEFRSEFFNLFHKTNFGIPVHQLFFGGYTTEPATPDNRLFVNTRVQPRTIQFGLKYSF